MSSDGKPTMTRFLATFVIAIALTALLSCDKCDLSRVPPESGATEIGKHIDTVTKLAWSDADRRVVLARLPQPMNSDSTRIVMWVYPNKGDDGRKLNGKPWSELALNRDGYYIVFDEHGKSKDGLNAISAIDPRCFFGEAP